MSITLFRRVRREEGEHSCLPGQSWDDCIISGPLSKFELLFVGHRPWTRGERGRNSHVLRFTEGKAFAEWMLRTPTGCQGVKSSVLRAASAEALRQEQLVGMSRAGVKSREGSSRRGPA